MDSERAAAFWEANAETWTQHARAGYDVYRDHVNTPGFLALLPPIAGLDGLDIGCGEGSNTRALARLGARMQAIDVAPTFVMHARETERSEPLGIAYDVADAQALPFPDGRFDFATAFMSTPLFHYTLSAWINAVIDAGFAVERIGEPAADETTAQRVPIVADSRIAPLFLHVRARKAA